MTQSEALRRLENLDVLIRDFGRENDSLLAEFLRITVELKSAGSGNSYFAEKVSSLERWAAIGFSARKHAKYEGGASQVRVFAMSDLGTAVSVAKSSAVFAVKSTTD